MVQAPPLALVHEVFGEFLTDTAGIQPAPDTFDFVLAACAMLAGFYPDEKIRQQLFNSLLGNFLGKAIYSVSLTGGVSATDGSIVDDLKMPEVLTFAVIMLKLDCLLLLEVPAQSHWTAVLLPARRCILICCTFGCSSPVSMWNTRRTSPLGLLLIHQRSSWRTTTVC